MRERAAGRPLPPSQRERAAAGATIARELAELLDELADPQAAAARRLADLEPIAADELCLGHGSIRDGNGVCVRCRRVDVPPLNMRR